MKGTPSLRSGALRAGGALIRPGASLPTCPQGHPTCFYRDCPVCRAASMRTGEELREHRRRSMAALIREAAKRAREGK